MKCYARSTRSVPPGFRPFVSSPHTSTAIRILPVTTANTINVAFGIRVLLCAAAAVFSKMTRYISFSFPFLIKHVWYYSYDVFTFFSIPFIIFALLFSLPPSRNSDPGSHSRPFPPPPHYGSCLAFLSPEEIFSSLSSLVDPRRIVFTHARSSQQLLILFISANKIQNLTMAGFELTDQHY